MQDRVDPLTADCRHDPDLLAARSFGQQPGLILGEFMPDGIGLVEGQQLGHVGKVAAVLLQFTAELDVGLAGVVLAAVDDMQQSCRTLDVAQKACAHACAFRRPLDQSGDIGDDKAAVLDRRDPKVGVQRGEGVVGNLWRGARHGREKRALARVRKAQQADIGNQLEVQPDPAFFAGVTEVAAPGRAVGRSLEAGVAKAAVPALGDQDFLTGFGQVGEYSLPELVEDLGADGNLERDRLAGRAELIGALAILAALGLVVLDVAVVDQGVEVFDGLDIDVTALAAVAAVRATEFDVLLPPERDDPAAAVARRDENLGLVEELHDPDPALKAVADRCEKQKGRPAAPLVNARSAPALLGLDAGDLDHGLVLAMTVGAAEVLPATAAEDEDFARALLIHDFCGDRRALYGRGA